MKVERIIHAGITVETKQVSIKRLLVSLGKSHQCKEMQIRIKPLLTKWLRVIKVRDLSIFCLFGPSLSLTGNANVILILLLLYKFCVAKFYLVISFQTNCHN